MEAEYRGLIDNYKADFFLDPLPGEPSCRETMFVFDRTISLQVNDHVVFRPLGCPLPHFAKVLKVLNRLIIVHIIGPCHRMNQPDIKFIDIGLTEAIGFEGYVTQGERPKVCETVSFIPSVCMMMKVHSGTVIQIEGERIYIEAISLRVWGKPEYVHKPKAMRSL